MVMWGFIHILRNRALAHFLVRDRIVNPISDKNVIVICSINSGRLYLISIKLLFRGRGAYPSIDVSEQNH